MTQKKSLEQHVHIAIREIRPIICKHFSFSLCLLIFSFNNNNKKCIKCLQQQKKRQRDKRVRREDFKIKEREQNILPYKSLVIILVPKNNCYKKIAAF